MNQFFLSSLCSFLQNALFFLFGEKKTQTENKKQLYSSTLIKTHHIKSTFIQRQQHKEEEEENNNNTG